MDQVNQYEDFSMSSNSVNQSRKFFSLKFFELVFIFGVIFSVVYKLTNHNVLRNTTIITKLYTFILSKLVMYNVLR